MQLGFPNGACQGGSAISVQDSGTVAAVISVNGSDMIPSDNGTHWALCILNSSCSQMNPGADQYYETLSKMAGVNSGASVGPGPFLGLTNNPTCDTVLGGPMCVFSVGQTANEFLAMTGPSSSSDPSSSFSTYITWTAS
jgi:hypothetical protein